ncbi:MAG: 3'-5' exonuclease [Candidatus Dojkabacteria bacterium]
MQSFKKYLNPLYKELDEVSDFSSVISDDILEKEEYPHLEKVTHINLKSLDFLLPKLDRLEKELEEQILLIDTESDIDEKIEAKGIYNKIIVEIEILVHRINNELTALDSPYFGKIVFLPYDSKTKKPLVMYIGKFALLDNETHVPLITDWRSPIANLYYQNSGPKDNVSFFAPVGERKGNLEQKRQFQISRARINGIYDAKSGNVAADEFLLSQLNQRLGKKLQDIVSTIQTQQNEIIRDEIYKPVLMQGVAGSGKTTILLHRLAYLFYTYKNEINPNNSLIIAPNQMFIDYVSDVLPNLGIHSVDSQTYLFWGKKVLGWDNYFTLSTEKDDLDIKEFKGSTKFIEILDEYFSGFEEELLEKIPYSRKNIIEQRYRELKTEFGNIDMYERVELAIDYAFAQKQFKQGRTGFYDNTYGSDVSKRKEILAYFKGHCNIYNLYKGIFKTDLVSKDTAKYTLEGLRQSGRVRNYRMEDLGAMVYLYQKVFGTKDLEKDYIMVDEAQDMSFVQLATLIKVAKNENITITGDLAQSIIPPFYINDWGDLIKLIKNLSGKDTSYYQLHRCYRTTVEIVEFANNIFKDRFPKTYKLPEAVLRHGDDVKILEYDTNIENLDSKGIKELVYIMKEQFEKGAVTCALLCRDRNHADALYKIFKDYEEIINRQVISYDENDYHSGLLVLPIENAKGLEFDSVIFADLNSSYYKDELLDIKLLYVGITRALHRVFIVTKKNDVLQKAFLKY